VTARPATAATLGAQFRAFLRAELATTPGRARAALRVLVASLVGTAIVMATHLPHGHWIIITIFTVSPEDAGASLAKGMQRLVGTLLGAIAGILITIAFANDPWFMFVSIGVAVGVGMYVSRTTSAPYASLLGTVTLLLVAFSHLDSPGAELDTALWRTVMMLLGVVLGTGAQVLLWRRWASCAPPDSRADATRPDRRLPSTRGRGRRFSPRPSSPPAERT
jgi:uncharacterized membrane protein YccC